MIGQYTLDLRVNSIRDTGNYYSLIELSDKTSGEQAVIFTYRLNNNSSNVFLLAKTGYIVK